MCLIWIIFWLLGTVLPLSAQEQADTSPPSFPGVAEVVPRFSQLSELEATAAPRIADLAKTGSIEDQLKTAREKQQDLGRRIAQLGDPKDWNIDRLSDVRSRLTEQNTSLDKLLAGLSLRLEELDKLREQWLDRQEFWEGWEASLQKGGTPYPEDAFRQAKTLVAGILQQLEDAAAPLLSLQTEIGSLQEGNLAALARIDKALEALRRQLFEKTAPSFLDPAFYRQFGPTLWEEMKTGFSQALAADGEAVHREGWVLGLQTILALVLALLIRRYRHTVEVTAEWQFLTRHPWATGIFVATAFLGLLYSAPPAFWRLGLWGLAAASAAVLVSGLLRNPRKIFMVYLLALLFLLSLALKIVAVPLPLYRVYLAILALAGAPLLLLLASRNLKAREGRMDGFTLALRLGATILLVALLFLAGGFVPLASRLIEASVETVFLGLFTAMAIRLGRGGIDFLFTRDFVSRNRFFSRFGDELAGRLKQVFGVLVLGYVALYLTVVWGIFSSVGEAWDRLLDYGLTLGTVNISVEMVLLALLVLYLSIVASWFIQAFLETEVFPRQRLDRGVRDSIKRLLHYFLVFIGFLLAMTLAGMELKNFAVLAGAFGIGIGFGLQNIVNNFISGLILLFERPVKVGDIVVLDNEWGTIKKIGLRSTIVETLDQSEIIVPNSDLISEKVVNWTLSTKAARVRIPVGVAYGSDVSLVLELLKEVGKAHTEVLDSPEPSAIFTGFGDSSLDFELRVWVADISRRLRIKSDLGQAIDRRFREKGVEIPFPQRDLHLRSVDEKALKTLGEKPSPREGPEETPTDD